MQYVCRGSRSYLYDEAGSELYERITELEEYYPFRTEQAMLRAHARDICAYIPPGTHLPACDAAVQGLPAAVQTFSSPFHHRSLSDMTPPPHPHPPARTNARWTLTIGSAHCFIMSIESGYTHRST